MTQSYADSRAEFKIVTGIELPAMANLETDREYPYEEGDTECYFDIIGGSALNYQVYLEFQTFMNGKLGSQLEGYPAGDEATGATSAWQIGDRIYIVTWYKPYDADHFMVFVDTWLVD